MGHQVFVRAYETMFALYQRAIVAANNGLYDAAAFYMRKILEVVADSFLDHYSLIGQGWRFGQYFGAYTRRKPTLDDKIDFLLSQSNIPKTSRDTYDAIRMYGNAAVHKTNFVENPAQHNRMMDLLAAEITAFHKMAYE